MADLKNVIYLSNEDFATLCSTGTVTIGNDTLTYDENSLYITPDEVATASATGLMSATDKSNLDTIYSSYLSNVSTIGNIITFTKKANGNSSTVNITPLTLTTTSGTESIANQSGTSLQLVTRDTPQNITANKTFYTTNSVGETPGLYFTTSDGTNPVGIRAYFDGESYNGHLVASGSLVVNGSLYLDSEYGGAISTGRIFSANNLLVFNHSESGPITFTNGSYCVPAANNNGTYYDGNIRYKTTTNSGDGGTLSDYSLKFPDTSSYTADSTIATIDDITSQAVRYDTASQGLNTTQKSNARTNIAAVCLGSNSGTTNVSFTHTTGSGSSKKSGGIHIQPSQTQPGIYLYSLTGTGFTGQCMGIYPNYFTKGTDVLPGYPDVAQKFELPSATVKGVTYGTSSTYTLATTTDINDIKAITQITSNTYAFSDGVLTMPLSLFTLDGSTDVDDFIAGLYIFMYGNVQTFIYIDANMLGVSGTYPIRATIPVITTSDVQARPGNLKIVLSGNNLIVTSSTGTNNVYDGYKLTVIRSGLIG